MLNLSFLFLIQSLFSPFATVGTYVPQNHFKKKIVVKGLIVCYQKQELKDLNYNCLSR